MKFNGSHFERDVILWGVRAPDRIYRFDAKENRIR
jgi:hypothetical protein